MRHRIATAMLCLMTSCAAPESPAQAAFALEAGYDAAMEVAVAYAMLPRCAPAAPALCSDPAILRQANTAAHTAWGAIRAAQGVAQAATQAPHADPAAALAAAKAALDGLLALTNRMKVS